MTTNTGTRSRFVRQIVTAHEQLEGTGFVVKRPFPTRGLNQVRPTDLDITISYNPNTVGWFGYVGIGVNTNKTVGLRNQENTGLFDTIIAEDVAGENSLDPATPECITIETTFTEDRRIQQCVVIEPRVQDYSLYENNCTRFVSQCLKETGIVTLNTINPKRLFRRLEWNY